VKHSAPLAPREIEEEVVETIERGLADAIIVSGAGTGRPTDLEKLKRAKAAAKDTPVFVGSGASIETVAQYLPYADGFIVGTALKKDSAIARPIDVARVRRFVSAARKSR
jgi:membrane complex biogenesis BtpA family protein